VLEDVLEQTLLTQEVLGREEALIMPVGALVSCQLVLVILLSLQMELPVLMV